MLQELENRAKTIINYKEVGFEHEVDRWIPMKRKFYIIIVA